MRLIDSHTHAHFNAYKDDMDEVVKRSLDEGTFMITVGTQSTTSKAGIELAEKYEGVWATIGLHPNHLHKQSFEDTNEIIKTREEVFDEKFYEKLVNHPKVVAIGEFGLDYYRLPLGLYHERMVEDQKLSCKRQLEFASKYDKPVVIHCRDAHDDQYQILKEVVDAGGLSKRGVIHSFTGTLEEARRYIELGFYIGFNGILTFSKELAEVAKQLPLESIVLETDAPYLTPPPFRGKRNEPSYVKYIAEYLAELREVELEEIAKITTNNTIKLFDLKI